MQQSGHQTDLPYLIASAHRRLYAGLEHTLQENGLTVEQWRVLETLRERNGCSMGELAELVLMNHPALTKLADRMVANGLIHRVADTSDQRRVLVHTTERGNALFLRMERRVAAHNKQLEDAFGSSKTAALRALLQDLVSESLTSLS